MLHFYRIFLKNEKEVQIESLGSGKRDEITRQSSSKVTIKGKTLALSFPTEAKQLDCISLDNLKKNKDLKKNRKNYV
ncbi:hypothetical protein Y1Q_0008336 [Alligator mississippiensis]|uniref:Uncharacterized protein n=1 Tax=Alligator mississippiensis TaxID=8496 RepID=A0A151N1R9_ALLMI|nr:hypothetical protein Y1Q_0008336 [Alligator mississippiensis]